MVSRWRRRRSEVMVGLKIVTTFLEFFSSFRRQAPRILNVRRETSVIIE